MDALVLFSAGQDSATCLVWALRHYERVETIGFFYGQRHAVEMEQRQVLFEKIKDWNYGGYLTGDCVVDLSGYGALAESALTGDRAIELLENGLPSTFVPGRNLIFLSVAATRAYQLGIDTLVAGMCETDFSGYPDCRRETIDAQERALQLGFSRPIKIETPLMHLSKAQTWELAYEHGGDEVVEIVLEHSHTCYEGDRSARHDWGYGCGVCPACDLRAKGWHEWRRRVAQRK